jgi:hypothetical protein
MPTIMANEVTYFDPMQERRVDGIDAMKKMNGKERSVARWNSGELYGLVDGKWRIVHSHWSYIKPELKQPVTELQQ